MKLWVGRHNFAGEYSTDPKKERERKLTSEGRATASRIAQAMYDADEIPELIFASHVQRAQETADIYGRMLEIPVHLSDGLGPEVPIEAWLEKIVGDKDLGRVMIVGHTDNTTPLFKKRLPSDDKWEPLVMGEVRRLKISRKDLFWSLKWCIKPSDLGLEDHE